MKKPDSIDQTTNSVPNDSKRSQRSSGLFRNLTPIEYNEKKIKENKMIIHKKVREVVLRTLAPKQVRYDYVSIREAFGVIGDGLPVIDVDLRPGREPERKKGLVDGIAEVLRDVLGIDPEDIYCIFRETPAHNHYTGGEPLPDWVPADK